MIRVVVEIADNVVIGVHCNVEGVEVAVIDHDIPDDWEGGATIDDQYVDLHVQPADVSPEWIEEVFNARAT